MIKFYLHGGNSSYESRANEEFYRNICKIAVNKRILVIPFAQNEENWNMDTIFLNKIKSFCPDYALRNYVMASANKFRFLLQIKHSDIIYIPGGDYCSLITHIGFLKYFKNLFEGKIIFGVSAGTDILCKYSYSDDYAKVFPGLGFLNNSCKSHYSPLRDKNKIERLEKYDEADNLLKIQENEFIVINS